MATKETIFEKGINLEKNFAEYIKKEMDYEKVKIRHQVPQANDNRSANIDVIGEKLNENWGNAKNIGVWYYVIGIVAYIVSIFLYLVNEIDEDVFNVVMLSVITFIIIGVLLYIIKRNNIVNIWVECKNLKGKVNITQVNKMLTEIKSYKESEDRTYKFKEFAFVSANGFVDNAIELAVNNGIKCFILDKKDKFKEVTEWN